MNEYKARMLNSPKSNKVLSKIFEVALDDEHKHQAACMKIIADRLLPVKGFEEDVIKNSGGNKISINITGIGGSVQVDGEELKQEEDAEDADFTVIPGDTDER